MKPADKMKRLRLREKHDLVAVRDDICREDLPAFEELARKAKSTAKRCNLAVWLRGGVYS